jgi:phospholipid/cholesterol/gamma-HCH transport system substrate-binding protein
MGAPIRACARSSTVGRRDVATTAANHWKLGLFVVTALAGVVGVTFWLGSHLVERESFEAISYFDESVQGLEVGSPVKWRGVTVGTVRDITVAPDARHVQVTSDIFVDALRRLGLERPKRGQAFIDPNLRVQLASAGITGIRFLQTDFFDPVRHPPPRLPFEPPWNYVPSTPSTLKSVEDSVVEILNRLPAVVAQADEALGALRTTLASVDGLAATLQADDGAFNALLVQLRTTAARLERALKEAELGSTTASLRSTSSQVGEAAVGVSDAREELAASLVALREALESVRALTDSLERDPSALLRGPRADGAGPEKAR